MTTPPARDRHPLADAWPPLEAAVFELWGLARPAIDALAAERGIPLALYNYAELGLDTLSVAEALRRDPYSRPEDFAEEFARLAADGWLEPTGGSDDPMTPRYVVLPHAREAVRALDRAGDARLGDLVATPDADLERLHELLAAIHASNLAEPEPPARWAAERRFRSAGEATPLPGRIREAGLDVLASHEGRRWLVLGDMGELGAEGVQRHEEAADAARRCGVERLYTTGALSRSTSCRFGSGAAHFDTRDALIEAVVRDLPASVTVLVKGSRAMGLEAVVQALAGQGRP